MALFGVATDRVIRAAGTIMALCQINPIEDDAGVSVTTEYILVGLGILLLLSILASKVSDRFGVPALLLFLLLGNTDYQ